MLKQALKSLFKPFEKVCEEAAALINGKYQEMTSKMWDVGKIIAEKRAEVNPKYGQQFIAGIAERMKSEPTVIHLYNCEKFYNRYPDINVRTLKSGLTPSHYRTLSNIPEEKERERFEKLAEKEELTVAELKDKIYPPLPEAKQEQKTPDDWVDMMVSRGLEMRAWLSKPSVVSHLTEKQQKRLKETLEDLRDKIEDFLERM